MASQNVIVQQPEGAANKLILLFHGVGDNPVSMGEVGKFFAKEFPQALVVSIGSPEVCDFGRGFQWFSVQGVTEKNRQSRIDEAMPLFVRTVREWQASSGVAAEDTVIIGFSQGTIMALESTKVEQALAGQIIAYSGRFANLPEQPIAAGTTVHLIHGEQDPIINPYQSKTAFERLQSLGAEVTLDLLPHMAHGLDEQMIALALGYLRG
ncbi:esterase [Ewingella americana]|uniref:esterase n=1 Tax=Ewingella americana TaxID=41202 RepID=UPI001639581C|nr:esterase [Ewingella americana]QMV50889.1 esterase [Ewingella americana]